MKNNDFDNYVEYEMKKSKKNQYFSILLGIGFMILFLFFNSKINKDLDELDKSNKEFKSSINEYKSSTKSQNKYLLSCAWCGNSFDGRYGWARYMGIIQQCDMNVNSDNWKYMTECSKRCATEHLRNIKGY